MRKVGWSVVGSRNQRSSQNPQMQGMAPALRVKQREMARAKESLLRTHKLDTREHDKATAMDP